MCSSLSPFPPQEGPNSIFSASKKEITFSDSSQFKATETIDGIPYFINSYWTAKQRQSHSIHEISYRACFKAQLPEFFIQKLTQPGDAVLDPFMGRGTTPVQAALMGRRAYGNDINPLSILLTRPRLTPITLQQISDTLQTIDWSRGKIEREDLLAFYHPTTLKKLEALRLWLAERAPLHATNVDPIVDWIRMVSINRLSGHSPGFFSGRSMPPNQAVSVKAQLKINQKLDVTPPERDITALILKKSKSLLRDNCVPHRVLHKLQTGAAWEIDVPDASINLVVTSPPFLDIVQYATDNWLRCWFSGIDPKTVAIDIHRTEKAWTAMVHRVLKEQIRLLSPGGHVAFEVGEVRKSKVLLERLVWQAAEDMPFNRLGVMVNEQQFTKTANCWGITNGLKGTNTNRIVLLQKR